MQKEDLRDRFIRLFGSGDLHRTTMAIDDAGQRLSRYFLAQLGLNTTFGVIVTIGLWMLGVAIACALGRAGRLVPLRALHRRRPCSAWSGRARPGD